MERRGRQVLKKCILLITIILFLTGCSNRANEVNFSFVSLSTESIENTESTTSQVESVEKESSPKEIIDGSPGLRFESHDDDTCTVRKGTCTAKNVIIPTYSPDGKEVTTIGDHTWAGDKDIESIYIPEGVITIGKTAFYDSTLKRIRIPSSIKNIEYAAFANLYGVDRLKVTFAGSEHQWYNEIDIGYYNQFITEWAEIQFQIE